MNERFVSICYVLYVSMKSYMTHPVRIILLFTQNGSSLKKVKVDEAVVEEKEVRYVKICHFQWCICVIGREGLCLNLLISAYASQSRRIPHNICT